MDDSAEFVKTLVSANIVTPGTKDKVADVFRTNGITCLEHCSGLTVQDLIDEGIPRLISKKIMQQTSDRCKSNSSTVKKEIKEVEECSQPPPVPKQISYSTMRDTADQKVRMPPCRYKFNSWNVKALSSTKFAIIARYQGEENSFYYVSCFGTDAEGILVWQSKYCKISLPYEKDGGHEGIFPLSETHFVIHNCPYNGKRSEYESHYTLFRIDNQELQQISSHLFEENYFESGSAQIELVPGKKTLLSSPKGHMKVIQLNGSNLEFGTLFQVPIWQCSMLAAKKNEKEVLVVSQSKRLQIEIAVYEICDLEIQGPCVIEVFPGEYAEYSYSAFLLEKLGMFFFGYKPSGKKNEQAPQFQICCFQFNQVGAIMIFRNLQMGKDFAPKLFQGFDTVFYINQKQIGVVQLLEDEKQLAFPHINTKVSIPPRGGFGYDALSISQSQMLVFYRYQPETIRFFIFE